MSQILILSKSKESLQMMKSFLHAIGQYEIFCAQTQSYGKALQKTLSFDVILVDHPFIKESNELSYLLSLAEAGNAFVIAVVQKNSYETLQEQLSPYGIFTMMKPMHRDVLTQLLGFAHASRYRYQHYEKKNERLLERIREIKLVDRAKCLLIENEYMSEAQAHRKIEQTAMNKRITRYEVAENILHQYEE